MTLETYIAFCKENGYDREEFKNYKFVLKHPQRLKKFLLNKQEKYEREIIRQGGMFVWNTKKKLEKSSIKKLIDK